MLRRRDKRTCTSWHDSCHGDPEIDECLCKAEGRQDKPSLRRRWGEWLERRDRCCHCARRLGKAGGTHAFGFWFCKRHWNAKTMGPWSDA